MHEVAGRATKTRPPAETKTSAPNYRAVRMPTPPKWPSSDRSRLDRTVQVKDGRVQIRQHKTDALVWIPLADLPELRLRLDGTPRIAAQVITDNDGRPWAGNIHQFRKIVRRIADAAQLPDTLTFMDLRRSGLTELGNAGATDDEIRSVSGHLTREIVARYVLPSDVQAAHALKKRRRARTSKERA